MADDPWAAFPKAPAEADPWADFPKAPNEGDLSIRNVATAAARGVPILGGLVDNAIAGSQSALGYGNYDELLKAEQDRNAAFDEQHPYISTGSQVVGGAAATIPAVIAAPAAFGAGAAGIGIRSLISLLTGAGIGGADAAVRSGGDFDETWKGAGVGAITGAVAPGAGAAAGAGVRRLSEAAQRFFADPSNPITGGITAAAMRYATKTIADPTKRADFFKEIRQLGDQAMLADVSPEWMGIARAAASRPGQRDDIIKPFLERDATKNVRLGEDLDASLGRAVVPSRVDAGLVRDQRSLGEAYGEVFRDAGPMVDTQSLAYQLDDLASVLRGPAQRSVQQARTMLNVLKTDVLDPDPRALFETRQALDGLLETETNSKVVNQLTAIRRDIDGLLGDAVPGLKDVDAQYAELARQREGLARGSMVLDSGKTAVRPQEMVDEFADAALPQGTQVGPSAVPMRIQQGTRAEIDRVAGLNSNDPAAIQRLVKSEGDWNRSKLRTIFGKDRADQALDAIDRETRFYRTKNDVVGNSHTAMTNRFGDFLDDAAKPAALPLDTTLPGLAGRGIQAVVRAGTKSAAEANAERFAEQLGKLAVAQGRSRDEILKSLQRAVEIREIAGKSADDVKMIMNAVIRGGAPVLAQ